MASVSIIGASGYTGQETLDRVLRHSGLELVAIGSNSLAGQPATALDPRLNRNAGQDGSGKRVPVFITNDAALAAGADVTFLCLANELSAAVEPPSRGVVIDLSGAHRFDDPAVYTRWYGFEHGRADELGRWSYALPEIAPPQGNLIANPGCYATAALLALGPVRGAIDTAGVIVDGKSGMTGAGKVPRSSMHSGSVLENFVPYKVGSHQHAPEIAAQLGFDVTFVPHLLPIRRGLIATCYVRSTGPDLRALLEAHYAGSPIVTVLPEGMVPEIARVQHTDAAEIGVFQDVSTDHTIIVCAIDNLGKGAAGQAVQNANRVFGIPETEGLRLSGVMV